MTKESIYQQNGYDNRTDYLQCLADDYDVDYEAVRDLADVLGENEDFDGLVIEMENIGEWQY